MSWCKSRRRETSSMLSGWQAQAIELLILEFHLLTCPCSQNNLVTQNCCLTWGPKRISYVFQLILERCMENDAYFSHFPIPLTVEYPPLPARGAVHLPTSLCVWLVPAPHASLGSICLLVYLSPLQSPREDNLRDMPHLVYRRPLKSWKRKLSVWSDVESRMLGTEKGVGEMYKILNDIVARHRQG